MLAKGSKVEHPWVRATAKNGTVHAVKREEMGDGTVFRVAKTMCGRQSLAADKPMRRFQSGLGKECAGCVKKVTEARAEAVKQRKALRSKKNQPVAKKVAPKVAPKKVAKAVGPKKVAKTAKRATKAVRKTAAKV